MSRLAASIVLSVSAVNPAPHRLLPPVDSHPLPVPLIVLRASAVPEPIATVLRSPRRRPTPAVALRIPRPFNAMSLPSPKCSPSPPTSSIWISVMSTWLLTSIWMPSSRALSTRTPVNTRVLGEAPCSALPVMRMPSFAVPETVTSVSTTSLPCPVTWMPSWSEARPASATVTPVRRSALPPPEAAMPSWPTWRSAAPVAVTSLPAPRLIPRHATFVMSRLAASIVLSAPAANPAPHRVLPDVPIPASHSRPVPSIAVWVSVTRFRLPNIKPDMASSVMVLLETRILFSLLAKIPSPPVSRIVTPSISRSLRSPILIALPVTFSITLLRTATLARLSPAPGSSGTPMPSSPPEMVRFSNTLTADTFTGTLNTSLAGSSPWIEPGSPSSVKLNWPKPPSGSKKLTEIDRSGMWPEKD